MNTEHQIVENPECKVLYDIMSYDGPLLSYAVDKENKHVLCAWADCDDNTNTWVYAFLTENGFQNFFDGKKTYYTTLKEAAKLVGMKTDIRGMTLFHFHVEPTEFFGKYGPKEDSCLDEYMPAFREEFMKEQKDEQ